MGRSCRAHRRRGESGFDEESAAPCDVAGVPSISSRSMPRCADSSASARAAARDQPRSLWLGLRREQQQLPFAAAQIGGEEAVHEHDERAGGSRRTRPPPARSGHFTRRSVRIGRIGRGDDHGSRFFRRLAHRAELIERRRHRELRAAKAGDEVAATDAPGVLHRLEHLIDRREAARRSLRSRSSRA